MKIVVKLFAFFQITLLSACMSNSPADNSRVSCREGHVTVSIAPLKWAVEQIADTLLDVNVLVPKSTGAENFDPTVRQITDLSKSQIFFSIGVMDFEKSLKQKIESIGKVEVVELYHGISLLADEHQGNDDPHIWLSVKNMRIISKTICSELSKKYPKYYEFFHSRFIKLDSTLSVMDRSFSSKFTGKEKVLIVHPSLTYLSRDYSFNQIPVEKEGKEPSAAYIKEIFDIIKRDSIKVVFFSKQDNPSIANSIASEAEIQAVEFDSLSEQWDMEIFKLINEICKDRTL